MISPESLYVEVALFAGIGSPLHYEVPCSLRDSIQPGVRLIAPLGPRKVAGLVLGLSHQRPEIPEKIKIRQIISILDTIPVVPSDLLELCQWISRYYFHPIGEVLKATLPGSMTESPEVAYRLTALGRTQEWERKSPLVHRILEAGMVSVSEAASSPGRKPVREELELLLQDGVVERVLRWSKPSPAPKLVKHVHLVRSPRGELRGRNENLGRLIEAISSSGGSIPLSELKKNVRNAGYWIKKLAAQGFIEERQEEELRERPCAQSLSYVPPLLMSPAQRSAIDEVADVMSHGGFQAFVLHGVTGSGKTEIYLRLISKVLENGGSALTLVPEIALSTQMESIFRQQFGDQLAVWHSGLPPGVRYDQWREVLAGRRRVVLGVRSAVFMPLPDLGLVIVDEEHDPSYKQEDHLRYNARDLAVYRAHKRDIPIVLGSATPSLQSYQNCLTGRYKSISLRSRVLDRPHPELQIVDMKRQGSNNRVISQPLEKALRETVNSGKQALLFLNRRGFATFILCRTCGIVLSCTSCSVSLTYHSIDNCLRCHYCGQERTPPEICPSCGHTSLVPHGFGTERAEEEVRRMLPGVKVVRIDRDTVASAEDMRRYLNAVREQRASVLIGTQMVAKGHDFPNITLVGILNADVSLQVADFRAGETTVQTLIQVAGRAGRGEAPGQVFLQTHDPSHYTVQAVAELDYESFCREELASREHLQYPPFSRFARLLITARDESDTRIAARRTAAICRAEAASFSARGLFTGVLGPSPAPLVKLNDRYRWHLFIKTWTNASLQQFLEVILPEARKDASVRRTRLIVDRDPVSSL